MKITQDVWDEARLTVFKILNDFGQHDPTIKSQMKTLGETITEKMRRAENG